MTEPTNILITLQRSHNSARLTAEEFPNSAALAQHAEDTKAARDAVAEYIAAAERMRDNLRCVLSVNCKCDDEFIDKQTAEFDAAHARMKGETK